MDKDKPTNTTLLAQEKFGELIEIMARLRDPENGCPWDLAQDFNSIIPYTIEEAYEVADAVHRNDLAELTEELGDLLLQIVFHAQIAKDKAIFDITDIIDSINAKLKRRHPHIFGEATADSMQAVKADWEQIKALERKAKTQGNDAQNDRPSALDGIAKALPALMHAQKLTERAALSGFDWTDPDDIFAKLDEEVCELKRAIEKQDQENIEEELGDMLFVMANLARHLNVSAETALAHSNTKFLKRFKAMEALAASKGQDFAALSLEEQENLWILVKQNQRQSKV